MRRPMPSGLHESRSAMRSFRASPINSRSLMDVAIEHAGSQVQTAGTILKRMCIVSAIMLLIGCSSGSDDVFRSAVVDQNVAGMWEDTDAVVTGGTRALLSSTFSITFTFSQTGDQVTGIAEDEDAGVPMSALSGIVDGRLITFTINDPSICMGTFSVLGTISRTGAEITGSYSGMDCNGTVDADFVALRP